MQDLNDLSDPHSSSDTTDDPILPPVLSSSEQLAETYIKQLTDEERRSKITWGTQVITYILTKWPKASDIQIRCDQPIRVQVGRTIEIVHDLGTHGSEINRLSPLQALGCILALYRARIGARGDAEESSYEEEDRVFLRRLGLTLKADFAVKSDSFLSLSSDLKIGRLRVHCFWDYKGIACAARILYEKIPQLEELGYHEALSQQLFNLATRSNGIGLVTGPTGNGKSTTLAALAAKILRTLPKHVLTIEDPIEYHLPDQDEETRKYLPGMVTQQEVGVDIQSFHAGIMTALRKHPDIVILGELRDIDSIRAALNCAETGHFVLATLHTCSATESISRIISPFPDTERQGILTQLSQNLRFILSQGLLADRADSSKKVLCYEFMANTAIKSRGAISGYMTNQGTGLDEWMNDRVNTRWDDNLTNLFAQNRISRETLEAHVHNLETLDRLK
jgi:Tfp pilus assembly protein, pilus retraction ATPase PilT